MSPMLVPELADQNPWWKDERLIESDPSIVAWEKSAFKWEPRLSKAMRWDIDVIYCLRGPRQVGKTTLVKLKIRELLREGVQGRRIFYWACDMVESYERLSAIIEEYIRDARRFSQDRLFIFLDEISSVKEWQRGIKYLHDKGRLKNCLTLLTGSHSLDLVKATETLAGRRGEVEKLPYGNPDKILVPMKFSEYVESRSSVLRKVILNLNMLSVTRRKQMLGTLAKGELPKEFEELMLYKKELEGLFDDYLLTGGVPRAINSYVSNGVIPQGVYSIYTELFLRDIHRWGGNDIYVKQILQRIIQTLSSTISWNSLKEDTEIAAHDTAKSYVDILKNSFVISYVYHLNLSRKTPYLRKAKKIYFQDPFLFHALRSLAFGGFRPFEKAVEYLEQSSEKSKLVESVVCNHLIRFLFSIQPTSSFDYTNSLFYWKTKKDREVDFVVRFESGFLPIELKYKSTIDRRDIFGLIDFMKGGKSHVPIVLTKDSYAISNSYIQLPVPMFILLV